MNTIRMTAMGAAMLLALTGCEDDASVASRNLSKAADMFEITRRVVFYNGITGDYMLTDSSGTDSSGTDSSGSLEGRCSITADSRDRQLEVTCKTGPKGFTKHFLGLSDNVTYFAEQLEARDVSTYHYRVVFKPQTILPDIDARGDVNELTTDRH